MVPEDELWGLRAVLDQAGQVHGGALVQEDLGTADYLGVGLCNQWNEISLSRDFI